MECLAEVNVDLISPSLTDQSPSLLLTKKALFTVADPEFRKRGGGYKLGC